VGLDTKSFARALRGAVRSARLILIGEIRDKETMEAAIALAGTGHLCIATLHANNCAETLDRIINMFARDQHNQIFLDCRKYLRAILSQRLVPAKTGQRVAASESWSTRPTYPSSSRRATWWASRKPIRTGTERGMLSFDNSLYNLVREGRIELEDALANADSRTNSKPRSTSAEHRLPAGHQVPLEFARTRLPAAAHGVLAADLRVDGERAQRRLAEILVERAGDAVPDDVDGAVHRMAATGRRRPWPPGSPAEGVRQVDTMRGRREVRGEILAEAKPVNTAGIPGLQARPLGTVADEILLPVHASRGTLDVLSTATRPRRRRWGAAARSPSIPA